MSVFTICINTSAQKHFYYELGAGFGKLCPFSKEYSKYSVITSPEIGLFRKTFLKEDILGLSWGMSYSQVGEKSKYDFKSYEYRHSYSLRLSQIKFRVMLEYQWRGFQVLGGINIIKNLTGKLKKMEEQVLPYDRYYSPSQSPYNLSDLEYCKKLYNGGLYFGQNTYMVSGLGRSYVHAKWVRSFDISYVLGMSYNWHNYGLRFFYEHGLRNINYNDALPGHHIDKVGNFIYSPYEENLVSRKMTLNITYNFSIEDW